MEAEANRQADAKQLFSKQPWLCTTANSYLILQNLDDSGFNLSVGVRTKWGPWEFL
ncbi:hypothetical protein VEE59_46590 (plasmid) [Escherichia coli]|uniref:Uncharacterized protein n=1 Tax=Escherichia coli TaxID=562 RepID=A0A7D7KI16_ECOLX|nr:hypothetical protein [Escherichia coli]QMS43630.1 hypothetical protein [Escherichia coli]QQZ46732.1 hypothetical protein [Escherichia coli]QQZ48191.1 hypothetical protein [Escherichia coli]BEC82337.1 hypothetical protein VEE59_46590 [Escherichia coli]